jgi:hypothetical protein
MPQDYTLLDVLDPKKKAKILASPKADLFMDRIFEKFVQPRLKTDPSQVEQAKKAFKERYSGSVQRGSSQITTNESDSLSRKLADKLQPISDFGSQPPQHQAKFGMEGNKSAGEADSFIPSAAKGLMEGASNVAKVGGIGLGVGPNNIIRRLLDKQAEKAKIASGNYEEENPIKAKLAEMAGQSIPGRPIEKVAEGLTGATKFPGLVKSLIHNSAGAIPFSDTPKEFAGMTATGMGLGGILGKLASKFGKKAGPMAETAGKDALSKLEETLQTAKQQVKEATEKVVKDDPFAHEKVQIDQIINKAKEEPKVEGKALGATVKQVKGKLPQELSGAKPRYSYGRKGFELNFASDIDKASYISAQATKSKRDADFVKFVIDNTKMTESQVREHGAKVKDLIKQQAKDAEAGTTLEVPKVWKKTKGKITDANISGALQEPQGNAIRAVDKLQKASDALNPSKQLAEKLKGKPGRNAFERLKLRMSEAKPKLLETGPQETDNLEKFLNEMARGRGEK